MGKCVDAKNLIYEFPHLLIYNIQQLVCTPQNLPLLIKGRLRGDVK